VLDHIEQGRRTERYGSFETKKQGSLLYFAQASVSRSVRTLIEHVRRLQYLRVGVRITNTGSKLQHLSVLSLLYQQVLTTRSRLRATSTFCFMYGLTVQRRIIESTY
jgi:hypothetical protein